MYSKICLSYDDVLLVPQYSTITTRKDVDISSGRFQLPIISSPMDTVTESDMAVAIANAGGLGVIHRYNSIGEQVKLVMRTKEKSPVCSAAIGASGDFFERAQELQRAGCDILCIDVAHGHHLLVKNAIQRLKEHIPRIEIMAGNVATAEGYQDLSKWGADYVRANVGGGSICSTRVQTGHGIPGFQTIVDCQESRWTTSLGAKIVADGGIRNSGDIVKALAAGADYVMLGSLLAGTDESPGETFTQEGVLKKVYRGMASKEAQQGWKGSYSSFEGVSSAVPYRGPVASILKDLERGIRSGFSYSGARDLKELQSKAIWVMQTRAGQVESSPHILVK